MWETFIAKRAGIEKLTQSIVPASFDSISGLELVKICDTDKINIA